MSVSRNPTLLPHNDKALSSEQERKTIFLVFLFAMAVLCSDYAFPILFAKKESPRLSFLIIKNEQKSAWQVQTRASLSASARVKNGELRPTDVHALSFSFAPAGNTTVQASDQFSNQIEQCTAPPSLALFFQLPMNLNHASEADLQLLPGVGPILAARISADVREFGPLQSPAQVTRVPGIGPVLAKRINPLTCVK